MAMAILERNKFLERKQGHYCVNLTAAYQIYLLISFILLFHIKCFFSAYNIIIYTIATEVNINFSFILFVSSELAPLSTNSLSEIRP